MLEKYCYVIKNIVVTVISLSASNLNVNQIEIRTKAIFFPCAGVEVEGSGSFSNVSFSNEEQGVVADPNQQLHIPEPVL